jgi:GntR family transcriptional regulator
MTIHTGSRLQQTKEYLLDYIAENQLRRNDQLPSEAAIAKRLGISRNTLREAYVSLENEGVIIRRHGIGTFVANSSRIQDSLNEFLPFSKIIEKGGYTPSFKTLSANYENAPIEVHNVLLTHPSQDLRHIKRLVLADEKPVIYIEDYIAPQVEKSIGDWDQFDGNMVHFLAASSPAPLHQIQSSIRAAALPPKIAQYFELAEGTPILSVRSTIFAADNQPVTYSKICFNSNIVELNIVRMVRTP